MSCGQLALLGVFMVIGNFFLMVAYLEGKLGRGIGQTPFMGFLVVALMFVTVGTMVFPGLSWLEGKC